MSKKKLDQGICTVRSAETSPDGSRIGQLD